MSAPTPPVLITRDPGRARRWVAEQLERGRRERSTDEVPAEPWDVADREWVVAATALDLRDVGVTVSLVLRGIAVAVVDSTDGVTSELLHDELARLGVAASDDADTPAPVPIPAADVDPDALELLALIADGTSVADAAVAVHVSLRTAERRLGAARGALGVRTTAEAVARVFPST